jgi:hypothetical protein|nr:MAG TPA: PORTAL PROTEIN [Caudoviricetes sp.]
MEIKRISPLLKKKPWKRLVTPDADVPPPTCADYYEIPVSEPDGLHYQYLTEYDLLNESCEGAHLINSKYMSRRPVYEVQTRTISVPLKDADGNPILNTDGSLKTEPKEIKEWVITDYEDIETVRSGLPELIIKQKTSHLAKNGIEIANEGSEHKLFDTFRSWKDISGIDAGWLQAIYGCGKGGDALIYPYVYNDTIEYTIFCTLYGDQIFPNKDDKGNDMNVRRYLLNGREAVDIFMDDYIETYVRGEISDEDDEKDGIQSWWSVVKGWFKNISRKKTEDGWERISRTPSQLGRGMCQAVYIRFEDTPIGPAMQNINAWERGASYVSDKMRSTAFSKLFLKSSKIKNLPPLSSGEEVIGVENADADILKASEAKYLAPPDISNLAEINLKNITDAIMQSTMSIDLQPEILKSGADSSQTLKLLLRREIQWAQVMWPQVRPSAKKVIDVLKALVAKIESNGDFTKLKVSVWNTPWMPVDEAAQIDNATKLVYAGILSKENARHELNLQYTDDAKYVKEEAEEELYRKTFIPKKAEADAVDQFGLTKTATDVVVDKVEGEENTRKKENEPKVNNQASRKDITE